MIFKVVELSDPSITKGEREQHLAKLFLNCFEKGGNPITSSRLKANLIPNIDTMDPTEKRLIIKSLNEILIFTGVKEISRRMYGSAVKLPLAIAYIQGLTLVADGHISMKDLFRQDAPLGLPTAVGLRSDEKSEAVGAKLRKLNILFSEKYPTIKYTPENFHKLLRGDLFNPSHGGYGGDSDTEGEDYDDLLDDTW